MISCRNTASISSTIEPCCLKNEMKLVINHYEINNFEQMLTFKHSLFGHFIKEANKIWYLGALAGLPGY